MKHLLLVLAGIVGAGWTLAATNDATFADSNTRLLPLRKDVVRLMAASLALKDIHVAVAQYRRDSDLWVFCRHPELLREDSLLESYYDALYSLQLEILFVGQTLTMQQGLAPVIYCHGGKSWRFVDSQLPAYEPRHLENDSMWLLFLAPGRFCGADDSEQRAAILRQPEHYTKLHVAIAKDLGKRGTNALLKEFNLDKILTPQTWFCLAEHRARFEVAVPQPEMPPLCPQVQSLFQKTLQERQRKTAKDNEIEEDQRHHGVLSAEFITDLRLILKQMGGQTGADRFAKITATEKEMQTDLGKALLRELRAQAKTRPATPR